MWYKRVNDIKHTSDNQGLHKNRLSWLIIRPFARPLKQALYAPQPLMCHREFGNVSGKSWFSTCGCIGVLASENI